MALALDRRAGDQTLRLLDMAQRGAGYRDRSQDSAHPIDQRLLTRRTEGIDGADQSRGAAMNPSMFPGLDSVQPSDVQAYLQSAGWTFSRRISADIVEFSR